MNIKTIRPRPLSIAPAAILISSLALSSCGKDEPEVLIDEVNITPQALIFPNDPTTDVNPVLTQIVLPTSSDGSLQNNYANALNCLNEDGGPSIMGFANLCVEAHTAFPDADGDYKAIEPPASHSDGEDSFAEVQMYHHVNVAHKYFRGTHEFSDLDYPLDSVVNINLKMQGIWQPFANAAYIPAGTFASLGLPARDKGAIMFGQFEDIDFAYDASVIYHEYSHAVVGDNRFGGPYVDEQGMNNSPGALNEGIADYFAGTMLDTPEIGRYALAFANAGRNLDEFRACPEDITSEIHADGRIIGSALWAIREQLGKEQTDSLVFKSLMSSAKTTILSAFGQILLTEAGKIGSATLATVQTILTDHGVLSCVRAREWTSRTFEQTPHAVDGSQNFALTFPDGVPAYHQWFVDIAADEAIELSWRMSPPGYFGGDITPLAVAIRTGQAVGLDGSVAITADAILDGSAPVDNQQTLALKAGCLPQAGGRVYFMFVNNGTSGSTVVETSIRTLEGTEALAAQGCE